MDEEKRLFEDRFQDFLKESGLTRPKGSIVLAVSGGVDSMVMTYLFNGIRKTWDLRLSVVHVNHHLRGDESDGDEHFVAGAAAELSIPFTALHVDVQSYQSAHRLSKQEAAREVRYRAFETARVDRGFDAVATAHHAGDNAETVLMNALRGAGIRGLSGIPPRREKGSVIRPLLWATRDEIENYAAMNGIRHREDSSNTSTAYTRNALRHVILPRLESLTQSNVVESLNRISTVMRSLQQRIDSELRSKMQAIVVSETNSVTVLLNAFLREPLYLQEEMMLEIFRNLEIEPSARKVQSCLDLCTRPSGRSLQLAARWRLYRERERLVFAEPRPKEEFEYRIEMGKEYSFARFKFGSTEVAGVPDYRDHLGSTEYIDADKVGNTLVLRNWKQGDWFLPLGMENKKKLSDFFTNEKVPFLTKQSTPILESEGSVVWVCGLRLDQRFRITLATRHVVQLSYSPTFPQ